MLVVAEDDATLASYRAGQDETRVGDGRTVERLEGRDGRLRHHVAADGRFEPPGRRVGFTVVLMLLRGGRVMVNQPCGRLFDGRRPFVVGCQRRRRRVLFAAVVPGHARDGRVPFGGGRSRRARARLASVHLVTRSVAATDGQRLPVMLVLVVRVLVLVR